MEPCRNFLHPHSQRSMLGETKMLSNESSLSKLAERIRDLKDPLSGKIVSGIMTKEKAKVTHIAKPIAPATSIFEGLDAQVLFKKTNDHNNYDFEGVYLEMKEMLESLYMDSSIHTDVIYAIAVFFTFEKNLPDALAELVKTYKDEKAEIPSADLESIQSTLHPDVKCHLKRIKPFATPIDINNYILGNLQQLKECYDYVLKNEKLKQFFVEMSKGHACFEDRILNLYEYVQNHIKVESLNINGSNFDPILPSTLVTADELPEAILAHYYDRFMDIQKDVILKTHPQFDKFGDRDEAKKTQFLKNNKLDHLVSFGYFMKFLEKETKHKKLETKVGKITLKQIHYFWKII